MTDFLIGMAVGAVLGGAFGVAIHCFFIVGGNADRTREQSKTK